MTSMNANQTRASGRRAFVLAVLLGALATLAGCGGGSTQLASGGIVGTGDARLLSSGIITATAPGSIVVTGQTVSISTAAITVNGVAAGADDLRIGMVVALDGRVNADGTATATAVSYSAEIIGVIDGVDATARTFTLLGQRVRTDGLTVFEGGTFGALLGQKVEVSGLRSGPADLYASWIRVSAEAPPAIVPVEVVGTVSSLDTTARRFAVGTQAVDYAGMAPASVPGGLANGASVRVTGSVPVAGGTVTATAITVVVAPLPGQNAQRVELEGFVSDFVDLGSFRVSGQPVDARSATFEDGSASSLANGVRVEVEGRLENGVVIATQVEFEEVATAELDGTVQGVDVPGSAFTVGGERIGVVASTQFEDRSAAPEPGFSLAKLRVGDRVTVKVAQGPAGWTAQRVERRATDAPAPGGATVKVAGTVTAFVSVADFTVAGQRVNASGASFDDGRASDLAVGVRVEAEGTLAAGILVATKVEVSVPEPSPETGSTTISGTISGFVSRSSFLVAGQAVDASSATFESGSASDLANGRSVEVAGNLTGGVLRATRVTFASVQTDDVLEIEGAIQGYTSVASFQVAGRTVDATAAAFSDGTASDLAVGRRVKVKGPLVAGVLKATRVEFEDAPEAEEVELKGTISAFVSVSSFAVASRTIDASGAKFEDGQASDLANGRSVEVKGLLQGAVVKAKEIKFR
jgi:Domain of unknown function (DUF5666)